MATMNLYLPDALKAEMEQCEGVNWSQVAQEAFRRTVEIEGIKAVNLNQAGIERLRASRESASDRKRAEAVAAGKTWALEVAEFDQLERVAGLDPDEFCGQPSAYGWGDGLVAAVNGDESVQREEIEAFCEQHLGVDYPDAEQVAGFVEGAIEVFDEV